MALNVLVVEKQKVICKCNKNEWNGNISAQLFLEAYEIVGGCAYVF